MVEATLLKKFIKNTLQYPLNNGYLMTLFRSSFEATVKYEIYAGTQHNMLMNIISIFNCRLYKCDNKIMFRI